MKLKITPHTTIKEVQDAFSKVYPALRIEFYKKAHSENIVTPEKYKINSEGAGALQTIFSKKAVIDINKNKTVAEFEKDFFQTFEVAAQVFRRSENIWLQTSKTDDWTLEKQNAQGDS